jgi:hypothetical protein
LKEEYNYCTSKKKHEIAILLGKRLILKSIFIRDFIDKFTENGQIRYFLNEISNTNGSLRFYGRTVCTLSTVSTAV